MKSRIIMLVGAMVLVLATVVVTAQPPGGRGPRPMAGSGASCESAPIPKDDAEKKILDVLNEMNQNQRQGMMNVPERTAACFDC